MIGLRAAIRPYAGNHHFGDNAGAPHMLGIVGVEPLGRGAHQKPAVGCTLGENVARQRDAGAAYSAATYAIHGMWKTL